jgi:hypothetical protein
MLKNRGILILNYQFVGDEGIILQDSTLTARLKVRIRDII